MIRTQVKAPKTTRGANTRYKDKDSNLQQSQKDRVTLSLTGGWSYQGRTKLSPSMLRSVRLVEAPTPSFHEKVDWLSSAYGLSARAAEKLVAENPGCNFRELREHAKG